jgi:hypothetical protein
MAWNRPIRERSQPNKATRLMVVRAPFGPAPFQLQPLGWVAVGMAMYVASLSPRWAAGDVFVLRDGGQLHGSQVATDRQPSNSLTIHTAEGVRLTLARSQVREVVTPSPAELAYEQRVHRVADTPMGQWEMSEWCREWNLGPQREVHLRRVLELDPDHIAARHALGYSEVDGEWVTQDQIMRRRGYQFYRGRWRLSQEIELSKEQARARLAEQQWTMRLKQWRERTAGEDGRAWAARIEAIRDPNAVPGLTQFLGQEPVRALKLLYLEALIGIHDGPAIQSLVACSLNDPDVEVFHECVDRLVRNKPPLAVTAYIKALEDENNVRVNRAANALGRLGDRQAIGPLITALVTTHRVVVSPGRGASEAITSTFGRGTDATGTAFGGTGFSTGGGPRAWNQTVTNQEVLAALSRLSGGTSFGFDQRAWRSWLAQESQQVAPANLQRR